MPLEDALKQKTCFAEIDAPDVSFGEGLDHPVLVDDVDDLDAGKEQNPGPVVLRRRRTIAAHPRSYADDTCRCDLCGDEIIRYRA